jgi:hypothetical protein
VILDAKEAHYGGAYADVRLLSDSAHNSVMEVHFRMLPRRFALKPTA